MPLLGRRMVRAGVKGGWRAGFRSKTGQDQAAGLGTPKGWGLDAVGLPTLLGVEGFSHIRGVGPRGEQMLRHTGALFGSERGDGGEDAAQGDGDVVDVVHEANSFSGERHGELVLDQ